MMKNLKHSSNPVLPADRSDKWHHSMCRYLGLSLDNDFLFGIIPGVCREITGRYDFIYTNPKCFNSSKIYSFSEHHYNKLKSRIDTYYGCIPFLWDLGIVAQKEYDPKGTLFFLPRDDQATIREDEYKSVQEAIDAAPKPITFLLPWRQCDIWKNWDKLKLPEDSNFVQMADAESRQFVLAELFLQHQSIYIPWPGTDLYYAEFLEKDIVLYDKLERYRTKTTEEKEHNTTILKFLRWGWDYLNETQKEYFSMTNEWNSMYKKDKKFLVNKMLGLEALKSPEELFNDLREREFLSLDAKFVYSEDYQKSYEWLKKKSKIFVNSTCSKAFTTLYNKL